MKVNDGESHLMIATLGSEIRYDNQIFYRPTCFGSLLSQSTIVKIPEQSEITPEQAEIAQVQNVMQKNSSMKAMIQTIVPSCHYCHVQKKLSDAKSTFTMPSGQILSFCNDTEMNNWKQQYNY